MPPLLVINSPGFSQWRGHFDRLLDMCKKANAGLMSIIGVHRMSRDTTRYNGERRLTASQTNRFPTSRSSYPHLPHRHSNF